MKKGKSDSMSFLFIFVIFVILIMVFLLFVNSEKFKRFKISYTNRTFKRIDKDIINPINRMSSMCVLKNQENPNQSNISSPISSLLIQAIKLNQVTIEEFEEIIRDVSRYQKEYDKIGTSLLQEVDRQELRRIFGIKLIEFVNALIDNLETKIKVNTSIEIERIKKQIEEM
ncbi:MAG: hypothetical protein RR642_04165 [Solibacillus sp.]